MNDFFFRHPQLSKTSERGLKDHVFIAPRVQKSASPIDTQPKWTHPQRARLWTSGERCACLCGDGNIEPNQGFARLTG